MNETTVLFHNFFSAFDISNIYELGWYAAQTWTVSISLVLLVVCIWIRSIMEGVNILSGSETSFRKMVVNVLVIAFCIGLYLVMAHLLITIFTSIYQALDDNTATKLTIAMHHSIVEMFKKPKEFSLSIFNDTVIGGSALGAFYFSMMAIVVVTFFLRLLHSLVFSICLFWGAVILPISLAVGKDVLLSFKKVAFFALFWPIVEAFMIYVTSGTIALMLQADGITTVGSDTISTTQMAISFIAFTILNFLLIAISISTPFLTWGLVNGSGGIAGMIATFSTSALAASGMAFKGLLNSSKSIGGYLNQTNVSDSSTEGGTGPGGGSSPPRPSANSDLPTNLSSISSNDSNEVIASESNTPRVRTAEEQRRGYFINQAKKSGLPKERL